jgi:hypothetical protein
MKYYPIRIRDTRNIHVSVLVNPQTVAAGDFFDRPPPPPFPKPHVPLRMVHDLAPRPDGYIQFVHRREHL